MIRILRKRDGYVLAWVICIFLVVALLSAVAITVSITASRTTAMQHNQQQVYYTAKSVVSSVAEYIKSNASNDELINNLMNNQGRGSIPNMGDYTVDVSYVSPSKIKIKAVAAYKGETYTLSAFLVKPPAPSGILPTDNVLYVNGSTGSGLGQCQITGDIFIDGDLNLSQGSSIKGFVVVKGTANISGAGSTTTGLFSYGNVNLANSAVVAGDLMTKGDLKMDGSAQIAGNVFADGSLTMLNGLIKQNATIANNVYFAGGAKISGSLKYGGNITCDWGTPSSFVALGLTKITDYTPVDSSPYTSQALPVINVPAIADMPELYNPVVVNNNAITSSGTITSSVVSQLNQKPWGTNITIDARAGDIHLLLNNTNFSLSNGINILIDSDGTHNVFLYLTGTSAISVNSNEYIGMKVRSTNPRLFIIGDGEQSVSLNNNSELDACIYIPNGTISASGSPLNTYKFVGTCIAKYANIINNVTFHYSEPDLNNTPLDIFTSEHSEHKNEAWIIESWGNS